MTPMINNESVYDEVYWSSEDEDENTKDATPGEDKDMKNESTKGMSTNRSYNYDNEL